MIIILLSFYDNCFYFSSWFSLRFFSAIFDACLMSASYSLQLIRGNLDHLCRLLFLASPQPSSEPRRSHAFQIFLSALAAVQLQAVQSQVRYVSSWQYYEHRCGSMSTACRLTPFSGVTTAVCGSSLPACCSWVRPFVQCQHSALPVETLALNLHQYPLPK